MKRKIGTAMIKPMFLSSTIPPGASASDMVDCVDVIIFLLKNDPQFAIVSKWKETREC